MPANFGCSTVVASCASNFDKLGIIFYYLCFLNTNYISLFFTRIGHFFVNLIANIIKSLFTTYFYIYYYTVLNNKKFMQKQN